MWKGYWVAAEIEAVRNYSRRDLAEKILLKLIEISPTLRFDADSPETGEGIRMAWRIADAFLRAESI
jgi:hypothetical protein